MNERGIFAGSAVCYLEKEDKILFIKFDKKWNKVYAPPGGKMNAGETPLDCVKREFKEETGLELINPKLKGISWWNYDSNKEGMIYIFMSDKYDGEVLNDSDEGKMEWIPKSDIDNIEQFAMNKKFSEYLYKGGLFEAKFVLDKDNNILEYNINGI